MVWGEEKPQSQTSKLSKMNDVATVRRGEFLFHDGSKYTGEWNGGQREGKGTQTYAVSGSRYRLVASSRDYQGVRANLSDLTEQGHLTAFTCYLQV
eukprot:3767238-Rhodomonas_salina.1